MVSFRDLSEREQMVRRLGQMKTDRAPFDPVYRNLSLMLSPANGRFFLQKNNNAVRDYSHIVDGHGIEAVETSVAGIMSIGSSPARPFIDYTTFDPELDEFWAVKKWLGIAKRKTLNVYAQSNTYRALPHYIRELLTFATSAGQILPHFQNVICHYTHTCGEYYLAQDPEGSINTLFREFHMTTAQLVKRFGLENCSKLVQAQYDRGELDLQHHIAQAIEPREDRDPTLRDPRNMAWRSVYWENQQDRGKQLLLDSGFEYFPVVAARWDVTGGDTYGVGPGNRALPMVEMLQIMSRRMARGVHQLVDPALWLPMSSKNREVQSQPGGRNYGDAQSQNSGGRRLFEIQPQLEHMVLHLQDIRRQVDGAFFADFFTKVSNDERNQRATAAEINAVKQEAWLMLGPFSERYFDEVISPMTEITFRELLVNGALPPPPPELLGREIGIRFTSVLAQAQEAVTAASDDRFVTMLGNVAGFKPEVLDKFNQDEWADRYAQKLGVDPELVVPGEQVALVRQARNAALATKEQAEVLETHSKTLKNVSGAQPQGGAAQGPIGGEEAE